MDPFNLARFVDAQAPVYARALAELRGGRKKSHWMWFVFPQLAGLGHSDRALFYAIGSRDEARAYLIHPLLGPRLAECTEAALLHSGRGAEAIFGPVDAMKFRSSMTLFEAAAQDKRTGTFAAALDSFFGGVRDAVTLGLLAEARG
ncbi:MAG TPA: DUF1810 domain-containing protein [Allosphingosinicella sp.]|nr:DUF1810 domain-containing protein [Allosphingosinicella sp.]